MAPTQYVAVVGRAASSLACGLLLVGALQACGDASKPTVSSTPAAATPASRDAVSISIIAPANGETVAVRSALRTGRLVVAGFAAPGSGVRVDVDCRPVLCVRKATANSEGAWKVRMTVQASAKQRRLTIAVAASDPASGDAGNSVLVLLEHPATPHRGRAAGRPGDKVTSVPDGVPSTTNRPASAPTPTQRSGARPTRVFLVGDSLAEGIVGLLPAALPGRAVTIDAKISRPLATGMQLARSSHRGTVLAISLFTNDDPRAIGQLDAAVRESARLAGPDACAVWATVVRPPVGGVSYAAANTRLEALAADRSVDGTIRIVPWARAVAANPGWVGGDGVHATPAGYRARARLYAEAIDSC